MVRLTPYNVEETLGVYPDRLPHVLPLVFAELLKPDIQEETVKIYVKAINHYFTNDAFSRQNGNLGFDAFGEAALGAGIIDTMLTIARHTRPGRAWGIAGFFAIECMWHLMRTGNTADRHKLVRELYQAGILERCLDNIRNHRYCIYRQVSANLLRALCSEGYLGKHMTAEETSELMVTMCRFVLQGHKLFVDQMRNPDLTWQSEVCLGQHPQAPPAKAARYAPRYFDMATESALWAIHGVLCRYPAPTQQFIHQVLSLNPEILGLLLDCAVIPRQPWYPETQTDSIAAECLVLLMRGSFNAIGGITIPKDIKIQPEEEAEYEAQMDTVALLTSQPQWREKMLAVWKKIEVENVDEVRLMFSGIRSYHAVQAPDEEFFWSLFEYRGTSRVCTLRLISLLARGDDRCDVEDSDLLSFLPIIHTAIRPVNPPTQQSSTRDRQTFVERSFEIHRTPMYAVFTLEKTPACNTIAEEKVLGPITFFNTLTALARRGVLNRIPGWQKLPEGTAGGLTLSQLKQIVAPTVIKKTLSQALEIVEQRRLRGSKDLNDRDMDRAMFSYTSGAEVARSMIVFDEVTGGRYLESLRGARKELVLCLGNAAEMALRLAYGQRALGYALGAVEAAEGCPSDDAVDEGIVEKNRRRVDRARALV